MPVYSKLLVGAAALFAAGAAYYFLAPKKKGSFPGDGRPSYADVAARPAANPLASAPASEHVTAAAVAPEKPKEQASAVPNLNGPRFASEKPKIKSIQQLAVEEVGYNPRRRMSVSAESLRPNEGGAETHTQVVYPKSDEAMARIAAACSGNLLFRNLEPDQRRGIFDAMFERRVTAGEEVIKQGDEGDNFYVVDSGAFDVYISRDGAPAKKVVHIAAGGSFGELALMYNTPRAATVVAATDSVLWAVDRVTFRRILMDTTYQKRKLYEGFLASVPLLSSLTTTERSKVADALEPMEYEDGDAIVEQGETGQTFYIIEDGIAIVTRKLADGNTIEVNRLGKGDYFGELALLNDTSTRQATVTASGTVKVVVLDKQAFIRLLGPCNDILKRNLENYRSFHIAHSAPN
eukprot:Opistho-2@2568